MKTDKLILPAYLKALAVMLLIIVLIFTLIVAKGILVPLFLGGFFSILFTPISNWLEKGKIPRVISTILSLLAMILIVGGIISFIITNFAGFTNDFDDVSGKISNYATQFDEWSQNSFQYDPEVRKKTNTEYIKGILTENSGSISSFALRTVGSLSGLILIPVFMFFFLLYRDHLTKMMVMVYKEYDPEMVKKRIGNLRKVIQSYIIGVGKVMVILAVLNITVYLVLGIKHAIFFGVVGALLSIIPYVGPFFGVLLPVTYSLLTKDSLFYPIAILGAYQLIQMLEGNVLTPKIVGGNVNLNAFLTLFGLLVGGTIWGIAGMILVIPTLAILKEIFELSESTKPYALLLGEENMESSEEEKNDESKKSTD
ncbi:AI-2E family transporter [Algoriphagus hitonicola]|uniref:Predicted PurR-regulated permease PerM n=1 Tax=Algoriphagus hitonicola TaxID=435880 RepID=A0A1I2TVT7_9BACT|nr:AI-2E family transporter [Algoriphagus hitonicola]SFG67497.1 Predicted PurR-regulated permease PerM [Algoriphagus hitonicola]